MPSKTLIVTDSHAGKLHDRNIAAVYNGNDSSPSWAFVDGNGTNGINKDAAKSASYPQLTVLGSKLYSMWIEPNSTTDQVRVAVYNGNDASPSWTFVDGNSTNGINKDNTKNAYSPRFAVSGNNLYATWVVPNSTTSQVRVAVYNGNDIAPVWTFVDVRHERHQQECYKKRRQSSAGRIWKQALCDMDGG